MRIILSLLFLVSAGTVLNANPIAAEHLVKSSERCIVSIHKGSAFVSCYVGYDIKKDVDLGANGLVAIRLPILLPRLAQWDPASILACCKPRIEVFDKILRPESVSVLAPNESPFGRVPGNCVLAIANFKFRVLPSRKWIPIVASYDQPLAQQQFHYLPTFEEPDMKISANDFSVTVFTTADGRRLRLLSKQKTDRLGISSRLNITPRHQELISVAVD